MSAKRRRFGPLFYGTLVLAALECAGLGVWRAWPSVRERWAIRRSVQELRDSNPKVRSAAEARLRRIGPHAAPAVLRALNDTDPRVRRDCCRILLVICCPPAPVPSEVVEALQDDDPEVVRLSGAILGVFARMDSETEHDRIWTQVRQSLRRHLGAPEPSMRIIAAYTLGDLGRWAEGVVPDLERATHDPEAGVRLAAAGALLKVRPGNSRAIVVLRELMADPGGGTGTGLFPRTTIKERAAETLLATAGEEALCAAIQTALEHPDRSVRLDMLWTIPTLSCFSPAGPKSLLDMARKSLGDPDVRVRGAAAIVLLGAQAQTPNEDLIAPLLASIGLPAVNEDDLFHLRNAIRAVQAYQPGSEPVIVAKLLTSLERLHGQEERIMAVEWLGGLGPDAEPAIPTLMRIARGHDQSLARAARAALLRIDPETSEMFEQ